MIPLGIVMPIYNTPVEHLREAADSILNQASAAMSSLLSTMDLMGDRKKLHNPWKR